MTAQPPIRLWALYRSANGALTPSPTRYAGITLLAAARTAGRAMIVTRAEHMWNPLRPERAGLVSITRNDRNACRQRLWCGCVINAAGAFVELYEGDNKSTIIRAAERHICVADLLPERAA